MKPETRELLEHNLRYAGMSLQLLIEEVISKIIDAKSPEGFLSAKKEGAIKLLSEIQERLFKASACYFCLKDLPEGSIDFSESSFSGFETVHCINCEYGKIHGSCQLPESDYQIIGRKFYELRQVLHNYYKGESYTPYIAPVPTADLDRPNRNGR